MALLMMKNQFFHYAASHYNIRIFGCFEAHAVKLDTH